MWPYDGQASVPLDAVVRIQNDGPFPADTPALAPGVALARLEGGNRVAVDYTVRVDRIDGLVEVVPTEPLLPDASYQIHAVDLRAAATAHWSGPETRITETTFTTADQPALLSARWTDGGTLVIALSQPLPVEEVAAGLVLIDFEEQPVEATVLGLYEGQPHLIEIEADWRVARVSIAGYAPERSVSENDGAAWFDAYMSLPSCGFFRF